MSDLDIRTLDELKDRVKHKLEMKKQKSYPGKKMEGYEEAMMAVLSIIHELKGKQNEKV